MEEELFSLDSDVSQPKLDFSPCWQAGIGPGLTCYQLLQCLFLGELSYPLSVAQLEHLR